MGKTGHFGEIKFYVKTGKKGKPKMQSFNEMTWNTSINISEHGRSGKKPLVEVTSKNLDEISMTIYFLAEYGVKPWKMLLKLRSYNLGAKVFPLYIGGRRVGSFGFVITDISNDMKAFYKNGKLTGFAAHVTFKEYPYVKGKNKKKKIVKSKKKKSKNSQGSGSKKGNATQKSQAKGKGTKSSSSSGRIKKGYQTYTVKKGDTLWDLAVKYYGSGRKYIKIYNANKTSTEGFNTIQNPEKIYSGWRIKIPC
ncbi:MAG: phage tail protein [Lachnospiraceae bacterium]